MYLQYEFLSLILARPKFAVHLHIFPMTLLLGDMEKEELRNALVLTQESAAIQILLECCLPTPQERASGSQLTALQAPQFSIPCFSVHQ
jgi:hypothetical protein